MQHVVMFSGGVGSWAAAKRVVAAHGTENVTLLFADTLIEDEDLYRFIDEAATDVGARLVRVADGRTPWQVFRDERFLGNSRVDPCSRILKRELLDRWVATHCDPQDTICYVGIDWTEQHRFDDGKGGGVRPRRLLDGWRYEAPLCNAPFVTKLHLIAELAKAGIVPPRLYGLGFAHNNCGGFCIKGGHAAFALLLEHFPDRYAMHEQEEEEMRWFLGRHVTIMKDRRGGETKPLSMREFRERFLAKEKIDRFDHGGCGCFVDA